MKFPMQHMSEDEAR